FLFFLYCALPHPFLPSFPTRRSSDLVPVGTCTLIAPEGEWKSSFAGRLECLLAIFDQSRPVVDREEMESDAALITDEVIQGEHQDRKSTRLNSSHLVISYAVFCLKKK